MLMCRKLLASTNTSLAPRYLLLCRDVVQTVDLRRSYEWYRVARSLKRKVIYHAGMVNLYQGLLVQ